MCTCAQPPTTKTNSAQIAAIRLRNQTDKTWTTKDNGPSQWGHEEHLTYFCGAVKSSDESPDSQLFLINCSAQNKLVWL